MYEIIKYKNRKLYCLVTREYVSLKQVKEYSEKAPVVVIEHATRANVTAQVLAAASYYAAYPRKGQV